MRTTTVVIAAIMAAMGSAPAQVGAQTRDLARLGQIGDLESLSSLKSLGSLESLGSIKSLSSLESLRSLASLGSLSSLKSVRSLESLESLGSLGDIGAILDGVGVRRVVPSHRLPAFHSYPDDPADSLYRAAREALNRNDFKRASELFHRLVEKYPSSEYAPEAMYYEGYALFRTGDEDNLRQATDVLKSLRKQHPKATIAGDAGVLLSRINGALAKNGDANAAERVAEIATGKGDKSGSRAARNGCPSGDDEDDMRVAALNALLQMDAERALPVLKTVLARRDACSQPLRKKAVFLVAQKSNEETADILLGVARNDPDNEVRGDAVFWMSQVRSDKTLAALDSVLHNSKDPQLQDKAIFALSQHSSPRAMQLLRDFATSSNLSEELRGQAIFWIGQSRRSPENAKFLRDLYAKLTSDDLRDKIIHGIAESGSEDDRQWLVELVKDSKQPVEARKKAIFWLGQQRRTAVSDIAAMYDGINDQDIREQVIFALSQRRESAAVDKLIDIAKRDPNKELRKKAIFWLGQSNDPRVKQLLLELINQ
ncbi:MAG: HEAT repeat domain-containing protein [Gemmatimonadota bacterium]|nr:HEAT repeat domain-containing protein [Gemmatimonadota bacterium]